MSHVRKSKREPQCPITDTNEDRKNSKKLMEKRASGPRRMLKTLLRTGLDILFGSHAGIGSEPVSTRDSGGCEAGAGAGTTSGSQPWVK